MPLLRQAHQEPGPHRNPVRACRVEGDNTEDINAWIESVNDGNRIIPTVLYSDGTHETNPPASSVRNKQKELAES